MVDCYILLLSTQNQAIGLENALLSHNNGGSAYHCSSSSTNIGFNVLFSQKTILGWPKELLPQKKANTHHVYWTQKVAVQLWVVI